MRKIALGMAVAATALAAPALARDGQAYFGADIGYADPEDHKVINGGFDDGSEIQEDDGAALGAFIGYDWGAIRTEAELTYYKYFPDSVTAGVLGMPIYDTVPPYQRGDYEAIGNSKIVTAMANALFDIGGNEGVGLSLGVGAGRAYLDQFTRTAPWQTLLNDSDSAWAYQGVAQIRFPLADGADVGLKYKYLNTNDFNMVDTAGHSHQTE